jgi:hypothetical protein
MQQLALLQIHSLTQQRPYSDLVITVGNHKSFVERSRKPRISSEKQDKRVFENLVNVWLAIVTPDCSGVPSMAFADVRYPLPPTLGSFFKHALRDGLAG